MRPLSSAVSEKIVNLLKKSLKYAIIRNIILWRYTRNENKTVKEGENGDFPYSIESRMPEKSAEPGEQPRESGRRLWVWRSVRDKKPEDA